MNFNDAVYQRDGTIKTLEKTIEDVGEKAARDAPLSPDKEVDIEGEDPTTLENYIKGLAEDITLAPEMALDLGLETITLGAYVHNVAEYAASSKVSKTGNETITGNKTFSDNVTIDGRLIGAIKYVDVPMSGKSISSNADFNTWHITNLLPANSTVIGWAWQGSTWYESVIVSILNDTSGGEISLCFSRNKGFTGEILFDVNCVIRVFYA